MKRLDMAEAMAAEASDLHDRLHAWLLANVGPTTEVLTVLSALTYEVGLCAGKLSEGLADAAIDAMLDDVRDTMRRHVQAYRRGLRT